MKNWRNAWQWFSMWVMGLLAIAIEFWDSLPPDVRALIPMEYQSKIVVYVLIAGMILRLVNQSKGVKNAAQR